MQAWYTTQCEQLFGAPFRPSDLQLTQFTFGSGRDTLFTASNVIYVTADVDQFYMLQLWCASVCPSYLTRSGKAAKRKMHL